MASSIDTHPQRTRIIEAIASRQPYRDIEKWADPPVTRGSLSRFAAKIKASTRDAIQSVNVAIANSDRQLGDDVTRSVTRAALTAAADPFLSIAEKQAERRARWMKDIEDAGDYTDQGPDYGTLAKLDRNDQTGLELHAKLAGRLDAQPNQTNIMIVCPAGAPEPAVSLDRDAVVIDIGPKR